MMKSGTTVFRVIVVLWLAGLTALCLGQALLAVRNVGTLEKLKETQLGMAHMLAENVKLTMTICKITTPDAYPSDKELQHSLKEINNCQTWDDLVNLQ